MERLVLPFSAIVNLERLKLALLLNAINPSIGGLLISGPKGTGKTTIVRALADLLPEIEVIADCAFKCSPNDPSGLCSTCMGKQQQGKKPRIIKRRMQVVDLPLSATEDRVVGSLDVEQAIRKGVAALKPGILAEANQNILYVDEVNLLPDHIIDALLDAAAMGINVVEREGVSVSHPARFIFVGSMNPEEGELRPQLLDRFPLHVNIDQPFTVAERMDIVRRNLSFDRDATALQREWEQEEERLRTEIETARTQLAQVVMPDNLLRLVAEVTFKLQVDGARPDIVITKAAMAHAAFNGHTEVTMEDVQAVASLALSHRTRQRGILEPPSEESIKATIDEVQEKVHKIPKSPPQEKSTPKGKRRGIFGRSGRFISTTPKEKEKSAPSGPSKSLSFPPKCGLFGIVIFAMIMFIGFSYALNVLLPFLGIFNFFLAGLVSVGLIVLFARLFGKYHPGGLGSMDTPRESSSESSRFRLLRRRLPSKSSQAPLLAAARPPSDTTTSSGSPDTKYPGPTLPALVRLDEGRPLFEPEDFQQGILFRRRPMPKWALRQQWRRTGSARSHVAEGGIIVGAKIPRGAPRNIHLPASISASALTSTSHSPSLREKKSSLAVQIHSQDVREKHFHSRSPLTIIFLVDLSVSMVNSHERLKWALLTFKSYLEGTRDRVGLVVLKDFGAMEVQAPTTNWTRLMAGLLSLHLGGFTPMAAGMARARETLMRERRRNPGMASLVVLFSDFLPNIQLYETVATDLGLPEPIADIFHQAHLLTAQNIPIATINLNPKIFPIERWSHHDAIEQILHKRAQELGTTNLVEVGIQKNLLLSFLDFYIAHLTQGRAFLGEELRKPGKTIPTILQLAHRGKR